MSVEKEALRDRVVPAVARPAQAGTDPVAREHVGVCLRGVLAEFKRSSQRHHRRELRCRANDAKVGSSRATTVAIGSPHAQARRTAAILGGDCAWAAKRGSSGEAGVVPAVGTRWFRQSGGMPPISMAQLSGRYLAFTEREEIAILHARQFGVREIARGVGRSPSTISRELRRNAATRSGDLQYRAITAQWHADRRARRPKTAKLARHEPLRQYVQDRLGGMVTTAEPEAGTRSTCSMGRPSPWTSAAPPLGAGVEHLEPPGRHSRQSDSLVTERCTQSPILGERRGLDFPYPCWIYWRAN